MEPPIRKQTRLQKFNYSESGAYFLTICTQNKEHLLSDVRVGAGVLDGPEIRLTEFGKYVDAQIAEIDRVYTDISIDRYVIMPNHVHLLISICADGPSGTPAPTNARIPTLVSVFKRFTNQKCGIPLWQRSYHDHIIRDEADYQKHWQYIDTNPIKWSEDEYYTP